MNIYCREHMAHAIIKADPRGELIVRDFKKSPRRIDLAMAAIMAFDRAKELVGKRPSRSGE